MTMMDEAIKRRKQKQAELRALIAQGRQYEPAIDDDISGLSIQEAEDLMALEIGEISGIIRSDMDSTQERWIEVRRSK